MKCNLFLKDMRWNLFLLLLKICIYCVARKELLGLAEQLLDTICKCALSLRYKAVAQRLRPSRCQSEQWNFSWQVRSTTMTFSLPVNYFIYSKRVPVSRQSLQFWIFSPMCKKSANPLESTRLAWEQQGRVIPDWGHGSHVSEDSWSSRPRERKKWIWKLKMKKMYPYLTWLGWCSPWGNWEDLSLAHKTWYSACDASGPPGKGGLFLSFWLLFWGADIYSWLLPVPHTPKSRCIWTLRHLEPHALERDSHRHLLSGHTAASWFSIYTLGAPTSGAPSHVMYWS